MSIHGIRARNRRREKIFREDDSMVLFKIANFSVTVFVLIFFIFVIILFIIMIKYNVNTMYYI